MVRPPAGAPHSYCFPQALFGPFSLRDSPWLSCSCPKCCGRLKDPFSPLFPPRETQLSSLFVPRFFTGLPGPSSRLALTPFFFAVPPTPLFGYLLPILFCPPALGYGPTLYTSALWRSPPLFFFFFWSCVALVLRLPPSSLEDFSQLW